MQRSSRLLPFVIKALTCASLALGSASFLEAADAKKADPTGTWTWTVPGRNGGPDRKSTMKLKVEGEKVTGSISSPGREGAAVETQIEEGKLKGEDLTFNTTRTFGDNKMVQKYVGKVAGDSIKGKIEFERNGEAQSREWEAKREAAAAKKEEPKKAEPAK